MRDPSAYTMPAIGTGRAGARISSASQATAVNARSARTRRWYRGPLSCLYSGRFALQRCLRLRNHVTGASASTHVWLVHADEDPAEAAVPFRIARRVAQGVLAGELLRDRAVD